jgi:hypothetical protein
MTSLGLPHISSVRKLHYEAESTRIVAERLPNPRHTCGGYGDGFSSMPSVLRKGEGDAEPS